MSKCPGKHDKRVLVVGVHVLNDFGHGVRKRVRLATVIVGCGYPAHHSEASHVININDLHAVKRKVFKIYPIFAIGMTLQVEFASLGQFRLRYWQNIP